MTNVTPLPPKRSKSEKRSEKWPFRVSREGGVEKRVERHDKETGMTSTSWRKVCSELVIEAETRSVESDDWGRLLAIRDRDGMVKRWPLPMAALAGDGTGYRERLLSLGLIIEPGRFARDALHEYIATAAPPEKVRAVNRIGWHGRAFAFKDETIGSVSGAGDERIILQASGLFDCPMTTAGTLEGWQEGIARYAVGNSRLALAIATGFAAPLLYIVGAESGGFHLRGPSSTGKSTALVAASSVWGGGGIRGYVRSWRTTANGLEGVSAMSSDGLLCLDEMGQVEGRDAAAAAYQLANGVGKVRATRSGEARRPAEWRLLFLSSGEIGLADKIHEDRRGGRAMAGQEVRIIDLSANAGAGLGLFESLHEFPSADAFARQLKRAAGENYGHGAKAFVRYLVEHFDDVEEFVKAAIDSFIAENVPKGADGQVGRVAARFGLVAAAGELATREGMLPWPAAEAIEAAAKCFKSWLAARGGIGSSEAGAAIAAVRSFIEAHGNSRFEMIGSLVPRDSLGHPIEQRVIDRVGYRRKDDDGNDEFLILPESWRREVCAGHDSAFVAQTLCDRGILLPDGDALRSRSRLPGIGQPVRFYRISAAILADN